MKTRKLGNLDVSEIGFGTMSFASTYGASPDEQVDLLGAMVCCMLPNFRNK